MFFDEPILEPIKNITPSNLWLFFPIGYLTTILIETPILLLALSKKLSFKQKLMCGIWLTACTYPIVVLVLPLIFEQFSWLVYIIVAESFAPLGECLFFWLAFRGTEDFTKNDWMQCFTAIIVANLASFGLGEVLHYYHWFGLF
jgi:hypothetical protein